MLLAATNNEIHNETIESMNDLLENYLVFPESFTFSKKRNVFGLLNKNIFRYGIHIMDSFIEYKLAKNAFFKTCFKCFKCFFLHFFLCKRSIEFRNVSAQFT